MDFEPLIKGISDMIGAVGKIGEEGKLEEGKLNTGKGAIPGGTAHSPADVERWLGPLSAPEKQVPLVHDYLRGHHALAEATSTGSTEVRGISVPIWQSTQKVLQSRVDADPEVQDALRTMMVGMGTPKDPDVTTVRTTTPSNPTVPVQTMEVPDNTPSAPQAKPTRIRATVDPVIEKQKKDAWDEFALGVEAQDQGRTNAALERIRTLHDPETVNAKPGETPNWHRALDYMSKLETQVEQWRATGVKNEAWTQLLEQFRTASGIEGVPLPKPARAAVTRFEAWADAQKPPTNMDLFSQALSVPRSVMSSADLSAPGRQGLLMISRPEYWSSLAPMLHGWNEEGYLQSQADIRNHPDFEAAQEAGLALTDLHSKLAPREEAFASNLAERIPVLGPVVKASEQSYTTFLNRLRFDMFSNTLRQATAAGVDVKDPEFLRSLGEWINTGTGRGGRGFDPGLLSTVLFSPRLAISRLQTFNPAYYYMMHPFVRQQAIKANLAAAAVIFSLVSVAKMGGARVTWDFRESDAGKIRIGNTRIDLGGGHFQFLRLFTQLATQETMNSETGKVTKLGEKYGAPTGLDLVTRFIIAKEAPIASFITDWLRGKDMGGNKFNLPSAIFSRTVPLAFQDVVDVLKDQGVQSLLYSVPLATFGVGLQSYAPATKTETIPFIGVHGVIPPEKAADYAKAIESADIRATTLANERIAAGKMGPAASKIVLRNFIHAEREKVRKEWIIANRDAFIAAKRKGEKTVPLTPPTGVTTP